MKGLGFFLGLEKYMNSRLVLATIWEGPNVVKTEPVKPGDTNPAESKPGTLRGDFCFQVGRTIIHGGDSVKKNAEREISLCFKPEDLVTTSLVLLTGSMKARAPSSISRWHHLMCPWTQHFIPQT